MNSNALSLLLLSLVTAWHTPAATLVWTNTAGGNWNATNNWNLNQIPAAADTVLITNDGTYSVSMDIKTLSVASLTLGGASGTQTVRSYAMSAGNTGAILSLTNAFIGNHGVLAMAGGSYVTLLQGAVAVGNGGTLTLDNTRLNSANVDVQAGGTLTTAGLASSLYYGSRLAVRSNGVINFTAAFNLYGPATNTGAINVSGGTVYIYNGGNPNYLGGLVNEAGGVVNFLTGSGGMSGGNQAYVINQGTIYAWDAGGTLINVARIENSLGTIWSKAGTLNLQEFNGVGNLDGIFRADAGAQFNLYATDSPGTSPGPSLQFVGSVDQFKYQGGTLTLPADQLPANLQFTGSGGATLVLGAPVTHALNLHGGSLGGSPVQIGSGGILTVATNAGVFADVPLEVQPGGRLDNMGQLTIRKTSSLTVHSNAVVNMGWVLVNGVPSGGSISLQGPMVNAGTVNQTNGVFNIQNGIGAYGYIGSLINEVGGIMAFNNRGGDISGSYTAYLINRGTIVRTASSDPTYGLAIHVASFVNEGKLSAEKGPIVVYDSFVMQPSSVLNVGLNSASDFGKIRWGNSGDGALPLAGMLTITLNNGYVPAVGTSFTVMDCTGYADLRLSGTFAGVSTPGNFATTHSAANVTLKYLGMTPAPTFDLSPLQIACRTFRVRGSATDYDGDGTITNFTLLLDTNVLASVAGRQAQATLCYDFPGEVTFTARATDSMGLTGSTNLTVTIVPLSPRVLDPIGFQTNGAFKMCMGDAEGTNYQMLANADLNTTNWVVLGPMENTNGLWRYLDFTATNAAVRYYRAAQLP